MARRRKGFDSTGEDLAPEEEREELSREIDVFEGKSAPKTSISARGEGEGALDASRVSPETRAFLGESRAPETVRVYSYHWSAFARWCRVHEKASCPADPATVADYVSFRASHGIPPEEVAGRGEPHWNNRGAWKVSTLATALAAIGLFHEFKGFDSPRGSRLVKEVWKGVARTKGARPDRKAPISPAELRDVAKAYRGEERGSLRDDRDLAILLLGFASALRRGELAALEVRDLTFAEAGLEIRLARHFSGKRVLPGTKTNPGARREEVVGVPRGTGATCPVAAVRTWLDRSGVTGGRVFRAVSDLDKVSEEGITPQTVAAVVKAACGSLGIDVSTRSGHSLRAGLITAGARAGKSLASLQAQSRHRNVDVLMRYVREAGLFDDNAAEGLL